MNNMRIIYPSADGGVCVLIPAKEWLDAGNTMEDLAAKDVPADTPYKIVDVSEIPTDREFRNAWEWTE
jgi:hypothetical protein